MKIYFLTGSKSITIGKLFDRYRLSHMAALTNVVCPSFDIPYAEKKIKL